MAEASWKSRPPIGAATSNWSRCSRRVPDRRAAQTSVATRANGAKRLRKVSALLMAVMVHSGNIMPTVAEATQMAKMLPWR